MIREILVFAETDSTNDCAAQLGATGAAGGVAFLAERQRAGRGRFGRTWESAAHLGIWCSLLLRPAFPAAEWARLTTWAAVSLAAAIEKTAGVPVKIKWPNDLLVDGRKIAGILIETGVDRTQRAFAVLGFGVNVNHQATDFSDELAARAVSLRQVSGRPLDRAELLIEIFRALESRYASIDRSFDMIRSEAVERSILLGKQVAGAIGATWF